MIHITYTNPIFLLQTGDNGYEGFMGSQGRKGDGGNNGINGAPGMIGFKVRQLYSIPHLKQVENCISGTSKILVQSWTG